jgi:chemotaxis protein MotB
VPLLSVGCVSKAHYDRCVSDAATARISSEAKARDDAARIESLGRDLATAQATVQDRDSKLSDLSTDRHNAQVELDEATAMNQQLRAELARLGKDVDKILTERGTLSKALDDAKVRLEELRKAQAAAEQKVELFRDLGRRFKPLADAGQVGVVMRHGQWGLEVTGDLLFDVGRSEIRTAGKGVLMQIARALQTLPGPPGGGARRFQVTAAVDGPEGKSKAPQSPTSTFALTATRAVAVVEYLVSLGVPPAALTAAGSGSFDPIASGDASRGQNRRVDIMLLPSDTDAPPAPSAAAAAAPAPGPVPGPGPAPPGPGPSKAPSKAP